MSTDRLYRLTAPTATGQIIPLRSDGHWRLSAGGVWDPANTEPDMEMTRMARLLRLPMRVVQTVFNFPRFIAGLLAYRRAWNGGPFALQLRNCYPILTDIGGEAGTARGHYFHQDLWAARKIHAARPAFHVDVGSRIDGFVGHLLAFMPVTVVDIRPLSSPVAGMTFLQDDSTRLARFADNSVDSLSSLHAVEHFGLGRYGDPIDPDACFKAIRALARILKTGGRLYFSVPIGRERLEFNAWRIFSPDTILQNFQRLQLVSFAAVDDAGDFQPIATPAAFRNATNACGLFEFTKDEAL